MNIAKIRIEHARRFPYSGRKIKSPAHLAALAVLADLGDRRGIKWELEKVDAEVRRDIVKSLTAIIDLAMRSEP